VASRSALILELVVFNMFMADVAASESAFDGLISHMEGQTACFQRIYEPGHLHKHPKQSVRSMTLWLRYARSSGEDLLLEMGLEVVNRGDERPFFSQGDCVWNEEVGLSDSGGGGEICMMSARPDVFKASSAQEGGELVLRPGGDRDSLRLYLDGGLTMVSQSNRGEELSIEFGADDRVFLLRRVDGKACDPIRSVMTLPATEEEERAGQNPG
jgi:hypothetical protein